MLDVLAGLFRSPRSGTGEGRLCDGFEPEPGLISGTEGKSGKTRISGKDISGDLVD
jgi:hypothetical protein